MNLRYPAVFVAAFAILGMGCSSGGDTSGSPTEPLPALIFIPDRPAAGGSVSMRSGPGTTDTMLELEIVATGLVDVQTVDFVLSFPGSLLVFDAAAQGPFLGTGASLIVAGATTGSVTLLLTRTEPSGASGGGVILTVRLQAVAGGEGRLDFVSPEATDPAGLIIPDVDWIGGTVQIVF